MSTDVNLNRGLQNIINNQPISNGSIWFAEDSQNLYIDSQDGQRIQITDVIDITNTANKALLKYYSNKIYIDGTTLKKYNSITGKLEIISELETEVLESENSFMYDFGEHFKATIIDHSRPKNGSIVIDKNGDIGIVTSSTDRNLNVVVIVKNKSKNVLENYDIYFDSNYIGNSVGTFDCPFSYLYDLVEKCEDLLSNDSFVSIHIKTNSNVGVSADFIDIDILKNVTFIGSMGSKLDLQYFSNIKLDNVIFKDLILINNDSYDFIFNVVGGSNILIDNCIDKCDNDVMLHAENNSNVNINNSIIKSIVISYTLNSNMNINNSNINTININGSSGKININDSIINKLETSGEHDILNKSNIILNNVTIIDSISVSCNSIILNSGSINSDGNIDITSIDLNNSPIKIKANIINFGTFKFNGVVPNISNNKDTEEYTGLLSKQVYDTKTRDYKNTKSNLESHLDAINNSLNELNSKINSSSGGGSGETVSTEYFMSKNTFKVVSDLEGTEWRTGDVMKYIGSTSTQYNKNHSLEVIKVIDKTDYLDFYFNFTNASYIIKYGDYIDITYNTDDDGPINMSLLVFFIDKDSIICRLEKTDAKANIFVAFNETDENYETEKNKYINVWYEHTITLNQGDRIIYIKNDWDKLVDNNDSNTENYKIVDTIANLNLIMTDDTRPLGLLAYVIENETMYQWVEQDSTAQWIKIFSSNNVPEYIKPEYISTELDASNWNDNIYSFELEYPHNDYDIEINLNGDIVTSEQKVSFDNAELIGLFNTNSVKAFGDIPTINIPVILKVVKK